MSAAKSIAERARDLADADTRRWAKALDLADELDDGIAEAASALADACERLRQAMDDKESAMEETGEDRSAGLEAAWDEVLGACGDIADAADTLAGLHA